MPLTGQAVIVTGASSGIGEATARALAGAGAHVALAARREDRLGALRDEIEAAGGRALAVPTDVTDRAAVQRLADRTREAFGRIDALVNNAGVMPLSYAKNLRVDEWLWMVDVNVKGVLHGVAAVLPTMLAQRRGHIVNVSSIAGREPFPGGAVYCASKAFVTMLSEGLRRELAPPHGVRVTNIAPGAVATELSRATQDRELQEDTSGAWNFKILDAEDVAGAVLFALTAPVHMDVHDLALLPTGQTR